MNSYTVKRSGQPAYNLSKKQRGRKITTVSTVQTGWRNGRSWNDGLGPVRAALAVPPIYTQGLNRRGVASKETGYVDLAPAVYDINTTGSVTLIATVAQGAAVTQRIGKKAIWKSLQFRGYASNDSTAAVNDIAMLIVYDRRPTGALPAVTDIIVTPANSNSMNNDANSGRFKILKRWDTMLIGPVTGTIATQQLTECSAVSADFYLKLRGLPVVYKAAATGAIGDIEEGALYMVLVGSQAAGTADAFLSGGFRTRFVDV